MFLLHKSDNGAVLPWEYLAADAGEYKAGQLVAVADGLVKRITTIQATTPPYLCMMDGIVAADELLPVTRVSEDFIYETTLFEDTPTADVGVKMRIAAGGLQVRSGTGTFEVVSLDGTNKDDAVRGRFI